MSDARRDARFLFEARMSKFRGKDQREAELEHRQRMRAAHIKQLCRDIDDAATKFAKDKSNRNMDDLQYVQAKLKEIHTFLKA